MAAASAAGALFRPWDVSAAREAGRQRDDRFMLLVGLCGASQWQQPRPARAGGHCHCCAGGFGRLAAPGALHTDTLDLEPHAWRRASQHWASTIVSLGLPVGADQLGVAWSDSAGPAGASGRHMCTRTLAVLLQSEPRQLHGLGG